MPIHTAIVAKPEELGRGVVARIHRTMRKLDSDPYTDTLWGIVTGLSADDALQLVSDDKPLVIEDAVSTTGINAGLFEQMFTISDGDPGAWVYKIGANTTSGGTKDDIERNSDRATLFGERFTQISPDLIVTSSHGFQNGIEMPWGHGMLVARSGELAILPQNPPKDGKPGKGLGKPQKLPHSPNPKVFLPIGNCLVGHIDAKHTTDSLILALQRSAAVRQTVGYTIETWYGRGGWGTLGLLQSQPGNFTVAEAWFFNHQQLLEELRTHHPKAAAFDYDWTDKSSVESYMRAATKAGIDGRNKDQMGLSFDRDVVALYGDPKYDARLDKSRWTAPFTTNVEASAADLRITITARDARFQGPAMIYFPRRMPNPKATALPDNAILADNFLIIPDISRLVGELGTATIRITLGAATTN
ncbi:MAG TPA: hypothetical protein VFF65_13425 [Phycisphaerales bacterium]|nr:hypothetical protein [Phycisphaerales bacterium]